MLSTNSSIFIACSLLGGMGWIFGPSQVKYLPPEMAVAYRFIMAGILTILFAFISRYKHRPINFKTQGVFIVQGICMFSINYILAYYALNYVLSGIVAAILSMLVIPNTLLESLFFKKKYTSKKMLVTLVGFIGIVLLFLGDHKDNNFGISIGKGVLLCCCSMFFTSLGANLSQYFKKTTIDPVWAVGFSMLWGGSFSLIYAHIKLGKLLFPLEQEFIISLLALTVLSTLIFILYQILLTRKGAGFAAYVWVITPAIALLLSWLFEGLTLTNAGALGIMIIMLGGVLNLILKDKSYA